MLRKLLLILFIGSSSASFNCFAQQEVTEDMLIGQWECEGVMSRKYYDKTGTLDNEINKPNGSYKVTYEKHELVMTMQIGQLIADEFNFERITENAYKKINEKNESKRSDEYIFISNDEYKKVIRWQIRNLESKQIEEIHEYVQLCIRLA